MNPNPSSKDFKRHQYWRWAADELYEAYRRICAYSCMYIVSSPGTIDHFQPKSKHPAQAYEWTNLRLALERLNSYKGDSADVIDPFKVQPGWFVLDFPSCLVLPGVDLDDGLRRRVEATIKTLRLNDDDSLVQERCEIMVMLAKQEVALPFLEKRYPFLAAEVIRQGIQAKIAQIFRRLN